MYSSEEIETLMESVRALGRNSHLCKKTVLQVAVLHSITTLAVGFGLAFTMLTNYKGSFTTGNTVLDVVILFHIRTGWLVGALGICKVWAVIVGSSLWLRRLLIIGSVVWSLYTATAIGATVFLGGVWGPQLIYAFMAAVAGILAKHIKEVGH